MTNKELLLDVIGEIDDKYIEDVDSRIKSTKKRHTLTYISLAAVFVILVVSIAPLFSLNPQTSIPDDSYINFGETTDTDNPSENKTSGSDDYYGGYVGNFGGCANYGMVGVANGEYFYFEIPDDGIYRYTVSNGYSEKIVDMKLSDEWIDFVVNDYALYYLQDDTTIHRIIHSSDTAEKFYTNDKIDSVTIEPYTSTDIKVFIMYDNFLSSKEVVVDGITGEEKDILYSYDTNKYDEIYNRLAQEHPDFPSRSIDDMVLDELLSSLTDVITHQLGDRTLTLTLDDNGGFILSENGKILEDKPKISGECPVKATKDYMIFSLGFGGTNIDPTYHYYIARANGEDTRVISSFAHSPQGNSSFFYYIDRNGNLTCHDVVTSEKTILMSDSNLVYYDLYADGDYIYICRYSKEKNAKKLKAPPVCYKVEYDSNGKPYYLRLIDNNIVE